MTTREIAHIVKATHVLDPASYTATQTSAAIDTQGWESLMALVSFGLWTSGTYQVKLTECATSGGTYTDVADLQMEFFQADSAGKMQRLGLGIANSPIISSTATDQTDVEVSLVGGLLRFVKVVVTGASTPSAVFGVVAIQGHPRESVGLV
jgi:hypothetical protein